MTSARRNAKALRSATAKYVWQDWLIRCINQYSKLQVAGYSAVHCVLAVSVPQVLYDPVHVYSIQYSIILLSSSAVGDSLRFLRQSRETDAGRDIRAPWGVSGLKVQSHPAARRRKDPVFRTGQNGFTVAVWARPVPVSVHIIRTNLHHIELSPVFLREVHMYFFCMRAPKFPLRSERAFEEITRHGGPRLL